MIESLHNHLLKELEYCNKKETTYIVLAVVLSTIEFLVNMIVAENSFNYDGSLEKNRLLLFIISLAITIVINILFIIVIFTNSKSRNRINTSISAMYHDKGLEKYTNNSPLLSSKFNILPIIIIMALSFMAVLVPLFDILLFK